ncbi:hypothetical protein [Novipirellula rosea]
MSAESVVADRLNRDKTIAMKTPPQNADGATRKCGSDKLEAEDTLEV